MFPYLIPIAVLSQITGTKVGRLRKMYEPILANDCIPLTEIPFTQQETFARDYLLRDCYVDIDLMQCTRDDTDWPCCSAGVQQFFHRSNLVRKMLSIQNAFAAERTVTIHLTELATENGFSYRTLICLEFKRHEESDLSELATVIIDRDILRQSSRFQMKK